MTHLGSKFQTLIVEVFLLADKLEPHHIVGIHHILLQCAVLEGWLCHCNVLQVLYGFEEGQEGGQTFGQRQT